MDVHPQGLVPEDRRAVRSLDVFLPEYEFSERHRIAIHAEREDVDRALRSVSIADMPVTRVLWYVRRLGRPHGDTTKPFVTGAPGAIMLEDSPGEGVVLGLTGRFWRLRVDRDPARPRTVEEFLAYESPDTCKAVIDFRVGEGQLFTETRVHVADPNTRRKFARYWRVIRPFSGLTRILFLKAVRHRAEEAA
jgi:hypothetical protein